MFATTEDPRRHSDGVSLFGLLHGHHAWQCRLDATGESFIRPTHRHRPSASISANEMAHLFASSDDPSHIADAILRELLARTRLPHDLLPLARSFVLSWTSQLQRQRRRRQQNVVTLTAGDEPR